MVEGSERDEVSPKATAIGEIEGPECDRARIAYATLDGERTRIYSMKMVVSMFKAQHTVPVFRMPSPRKPGR